MKQRIRVAAIIKDENGVLILKRNRGRSETPVFWELPTGKIEFGAQPEESIAHALQNYVGLTVETIKIRDAITFMALEGASRLSNLYLVYEITIPENQKPRPHDRYTAYKYIKDFANSGLRLNEATAAVLSIVENQAATPSADNRATANSATIHVDGASRGNPGPSGLGFAIYDEHGALLEKGGEFIGFATSRVAEYYAMKKGIERALELGIKSARFLSDSMMVVNQLNGLFAPKNQDILPMYYAIQDLLKNFDHVSFTHIPRSDNALADAEANLAIDNLLEKR